MRRKSTKKPVVHKILIDDQGIVHFIYDDDLTCLMQMGKAEIHRASHVEPTPLGQRGWIADMSPVNGPMLGPYKLRAQALVAEREWLEANVLR